MDLPFAVDDEPSSPGTSSGEALLASVLIVDDEEVVLDVLRHLLGRETDLHVATALTAEAALELLRARRFDLLITDKNLPGLGGVELIAEARKVRPTIEAMMITGYASSQSVLAALAAGASDYLRKPFDDLKVVRARIRAALGRRTERVKERDEAKRIAQEATALLAQGKTVPEPIWATLDRELRMYETAIQEEGAGVVRVIDCADALAALCANRVEATGAGPEDAALAAADVVVIATDRPGWRELAERLAAAAPDLVLLARADADLADLLDALSLHVDLVGFGTTSHTAQRLMVDKVKALLMRRNIERTHASLSRALDEFRAALREA